MFHSRSSGVGALAAPVGRCFYSLGRADYAKSVHWQRGLVLQDNYGALAFLELIDNDIRITVRSPYPERFLAALTYEIKWLVESFWEGLRCEVTVPCLVPRPDGKACIGLFEVGKLLENKRQEFLWVHPQYEGEY